jgi:hypothetical protein
MLALSKKQTTMKQILLFALMTFFVHTSFCQNLSDTVNVEYSKNSPKRLTIGFSSPFLGLIFLSSPNLNKFIDDRNISTRNYMISIPLNVSYQQNRFKIGLEAYYGFSSDCNCNRLSSSTKADIIGGSIGYAVFSERNYFIYFNLGVGYADYLKVIDVDKPQTTSLASALQSGAGQSVSLKNSGTFLDFSIESVIRTKKAQALGRTIKIGYRYGLQENEWTSKLNNITDTPADRISSFYVQALLTLPYLSSKKLND